LKKLGEFPLVEGSFKNLTFIGLPSAKFQSSHENKFNQFSNEFRCAFFFLDLEEVIKFAKRNKEEFSQTLRAQGKNYGYFNKYHN